MSAWVRRWWPLVLGLTAIALTGLLGPAADSGEAYDPTSAAPAGTRGMLDVLRELGHDVTLELDPEADVLLVVEDRLDDATRDRLRDLTEAGARLVVADPFSPLADADLVGQAISDPFGPTSRLPGCDWPALGDVDGVTSAAWFGLVASDEEPTTHRCFPVGDGHALLVRDRGAGQLVTLASPEALTNRRLEERGNALLAVRLLASSEVSSLSVVPPPAPGAGTDSLTDLVADRVWTALWVGAAAFVLLAWAYARRLGRPVSEGLPVRVPGSELVHAVGALLQRSSARDAAVRALRRRAIEDLAARLGLTVDVPLDVLIDRLQHATGDDPDTLRTLLTDPVSTDDGLTAVQAGLARLRARVAAPTTTTLTSSALGVDDAPHTGDHP